MTPTEQTELTASFEAFAERRGLGCDFAKTPDAGPYDPAYADHRTDLLYSLYRAGYARARCCYGMVAEG